MKTNRFIIRFFCVVALTTLFMFCSKEDTLNTNTKFNNLNLNYNLFNSLTNDSATNLFSSLIIFNKNTRQFESTGSLIASRNNSEDFESLLISSSTIDLDDLNDIFDVESTSILALTLFKNNDQISGLSIHHKESDSDEIKLYVYNSVEESIFERINMDAKMVNEFKHDQLFYISKEYFPGLDMETLAVDDINDYASDEKIDDFAIMEVVSRLGEGNRYNDFELTNGDEFIDDGGKACGIVPNCWNGGPNTYCASFAQGCRLFGNGGGCARTSVSNRLSDTNMNTELSEFELLLPNELLYSLEDKLASYEIGSFLVEAYYSVSKQFNETLDVELLLEILVSSNDLKELVTAFVHDDSGYRLNDNNYQKIVSVLNLSIVKSQNKVYKAFMSELIQNFEIFNGKNISEIKTLLIQIE